MSNSAKRRELQTPDEGKVVAVNADNEQIDEVQVDFEGRNPEDPDFHGIKTLLQQLFLKAHIDLSGLTELIISQNYVGSVLKEVKDEEDVDEDDDNENIVYGITTVINISNRQDVKCIQQLRGLLKQHAEENATDAVNTMIKSILENDSAPLGLIINERFVNIPAQISVPLLENLVSEMKRAVNKKMPFNFSYFILICKLYKNQDKKNKRSKNKQKDTEEPEILWSNPEEEIFAEEATCSFEFSVESESDKGLTGTWIEDDAELVPYRRVLIFESSKLQQMIDKLKSELA